MLVLGIETSCDETAVGVVEDRFTMRSSIVASQADRHAPFGGVLPEVAARAHLELMLPTIDLALAEAGVAMSEIDAVAVTSGPGLAGALLVGVAAAKALALATGVPIVGVNHLTAHVYAAQLEFGELDRSLVALVVSGGHTSIVALKDGIFSTLGSTVDDAAGEAFDKIARFLGLGYPGGPEIDRVAVGGDPAAIQFPRPMQDDGSFDFSLSGLKTAVIRHLREADEQGAPPDVRDVAASFQESIVDVQVTKTLAAAAACDVDTIVIAGGVAANSRLRARMSEACAAAQVRLLAPSPALCTDNGAMVAAAGGNDLAADSGRRSRGSGLGFSVEPNRGFGLPA